MPPDDKHRGTPMFPSSMAPAKKAIAKGSVEAHGIYVNSPKPPPLVSTKDVQDVGLIEDFAAKLKDNPAVLNEIYTIKVRGTVFPSGLVSPGWWRRPATPPRYKWKDDLQRWKFLSFNDWGSPSFDWSWGDALEWAANSGKRTRFVAQIGSGDEADFFPVSMPKDRATYLHGALEPWGGVVVDLTCAFGQRKQFPGFATAEQKDAGGNLNYCFFLKSMDEDPRHKIEIPGVETDYYSGYMWKCFTPRLYLSKPNLAVPDLFFIWSHVDFTKTDVVSESQDHLDWQEERMKLRLKERYGLENMTLLAKSSSHISGKPEWTVQSFYELLEPSAANGAHAGEPPTA